MSRMKRRNSVSATVSKEKYMNTTLLRAATDSTFFIDWSDDYLIGYLINPLVYRTENSSNLSPTVQNPTIFN